MVEKKTDSAPRGAGLLGVIFGWVSPQDKEEVQEREILKRIAPLSAKAASRPIGAMCNPWASKQRKRALRRRVNRRKPRLKPWEDEA